MLKMKINLRLLAGAVALIILSGCKVDVTADIYSRDVFASENLTFPSEMKIEVSSCKSEKVDEISGQILAIFSDVSEASIAGCERSGMDSMLVVKFTGEMVNKKSGYDLIVFRNKQPEFTYLTVAFHQNFLKRVKQLMSSQMVSMKYDDLTIGFTVNNDLPGELGYSLVSGWVDGIPGQRISGTLDRREKINITRSKVVSHLVLENKFPDIIALRKEQE